MKMIPVLLLTAALAWGFSGCGGETVEVSEMEKVSDAGKITGAGITSAGVTKPVRVDYTEDEAPVHEEAGGIKIGDSLDDLKRAYDKLYYTTAYYDPSQGGPKYNRVYYTPMEDRDREVECLEFYLYDKKVVKITASVQDVLEWRSYEDIFGMKDVYKENNMIGHSGNIVYFYNDAAGNEQILLKAEDCSTEEKDVDGDGITEIVAYKAGSARAIDIYDYDAGTTTTLRLDVCETLGADWSEYMGNAGNVKPEYARCIEAGFHEAGAPDRIEVYSIKDNILTYIGPYGKEMLQ